MGCDHDKPGKMRCAGTGMPGGARGAGLAALGGAGRARLVSARGMIGEWETASGAPTWTRRRLGMS